MIETCPPTLTVQIQDLISKDPLQNPYLYIDVNTYGFLGDNIRTYLIRRDAHTPVIIYQYYNSLQLWTDENSPLDTRIINDMVQFITQHKFVMVSGLTPLITSLKNFLPAYGQTDGHLFKYQTSSKHLQKDSPAFQWASTPQEFERLAAFIASDPDIGSHYTVPQLTQQLQERHDKYGCQNVFLEQGGDIIAHGATYACYKHLAVIGGLLTSPSQRGKGIARQLMSFLSVQCVQRFDQQPVLYCYNPALFKFYNTCGYQAVYNCSKLEFKGDKHA